MPLIMWLLWKNKLKVSDSKGCILFTLWSSHSSFFVFLSLYLICSSLTRLHHFLVPLQPLPLHVLSLIHHSLAFFFLRVFSRDRDQEQDGLRCWARYWLSFVFLICFISVRCWEEGWGNTKTMRIRYRVDYLGRLPVKSVSILHY